MGICTEQHPLVSMLKLLLFTLFISILLYSHQMAGAAAAAGRKSDIDCVSSSSSGKYPRRMDVQMQTSDARRLSVSSYLQRLRTAEEANGGHDHNSQPSKKITKRMGTEISSYVSESKSGVKHSDSADAATHSLATELPHVSKRMNLQLSTSPIDFESAHGDPMESDLESKGSKRMDFDLTAADDSSLTDHQMHPLEEGQCLYTITIVTGNKWGAGTDSTISLALYNRDQDRAYFPVLDNGKNNFEKGHLDTFTELGPCVEHICGMILSTDNSGLFPDWYVGTFSFSVTAPRSGHQEKTWELHQWLPKDDAAASLFVMKDDCSYASAPSPPAAP